nr:hypothetical protein [Tanacetum cinerariifolium]
MERVVSGNNYTRVTYNNSTRKTHPSAYRKIAPRAVLMKTGLRPLNTARLVNTAHPKTIVNSVRPMSRQKQFNTARPRAVNTVRPRVVNIARPNSTVVNAVRENQGHAHKEDQGYVDSGCSRHITGNMSYLSDFNTKLMLLGKLTTAIDVNAVEDEHKTTTFNDPLLSESTKYNQALEIRSLKMRMKKLEKKSSKKTHKLKRLYKICSSTRVESSKDACLGDQEDASKQGMMIEDLDADEGFKLVDETQERNDKDMFDTSILDVKEAVAKKKVSTGDLVPSASEVVTTAGGNIALIESWDNTQAMIDIDYELAVRLQEEERGELTIEEKSRLFVELRDKRKKYFSRFRAENIRKFMKGSEKATEGTSKRAGGKLEQKDTKRQRIEEENESAELKRCLEIIPDDNDDVTIEATPLSSKSLTIVDYKIYKEGRKSFFKIIKADGNSQNYLTFGKMFKNFNREDLEVLWSIVKARFQKAKPVDDMDNLLFQTLKIMFEHHVQDNIWMYQQGTTKVLNWKFFYSCGVYCVTTQNMVYYLLVEKMYPFTRNILHQMWNNVRLQVDYELEMAYELLKLIRRQISEGYVPE